MNTPSPLRRMAVLSLSLFIVFPLTGCLGALVPDKAWEVADNVGRKLPVIGPRCEHWQCVTGTGKALSDWKKWEMAAATKPIIPNMPHSYQEDECYDEVAVMYVSYTPVNYYDDTSPKWD